jgi:hypothetical protein
VDELAPVPITDHAASAGSAPSRNLLILHTPERQGLSDWVQVKQRIEATAPDIEVRIATNGSPNSVTQRWQVRRPSLVFSVCQLLEYKPRGGTVYAAHPMSKLEQIERLAAVGVPVPRTALLTRDLALDQPTWGRYVVVKPWGGGMGRDVQLLRTEEAAARRSELTLQGTRHMVIQPYVDHSEDGYPTEYRVLTMFGRVLYAARNRWGAQRRPLEQIAADPDGIIASNDKTFGRVRTICNDPAVIALGERAHAAFPECPTLGVDIVRTADTGELFVMEVNPEGRSWHFSSTLTRTFPAEHVRDLYAQFDALDRVASLLIDKTRAEAT